MDYNTIGWAGVLALGAAFFGIVWSIASVGARSADRVMAASLALGVLGFSCIAVAGAMQSIEGRKNCEARGGVYLARERTCLTPDLFKGRLP